MKKLLNAQNLMFLLLMTFIGSIAYTIVRIILAPAVAPSSEIVVRVKSDYILMLLQSVLGAFAVFLPGFLRSKAHLNIPAFMIIAYAVFLYCAIYLGEVQKFYYNVPHWDTVLHAFSGAALGALGFSLVSLLTRSEAVAFSLSHIFVALFAFCFALSLGVLWEIYEFTMDALVHTNMQKYALENGAQLVGQAALADTMKDLIVDAAGAFAISVIGYISLKYEKGWLERFKVRFSEDDETPSTMK